MRSSNVLKTFFFIGVFLLFFKITDIVLYPCTFTRNDVNNVVDNEYEDIYVGTSHGKMSLWPEYIDGKTGNNSFNLCVGGEYPADIYYLIKLINEKQNPKRIIYEVDPGYYMVEKEPGNNFMLFYHEFPLSKTKAEYLCNVMLKCDIRSILMPWYEYDLKYEVKNIPETVMKKFRRDFSEEGFETENLKYHSDGFIERSPVDISNDEVSVQHLFESENLNENNMEYLEKIIELCKEESIELITVTTPLPDETLNTYKENFNEANSYFEKYFEEKDVRYYNFNGKYYDYGLHDKVFFTDYDGHMNGEGAKIFSKILANFVIQ